MSHISANSRKDLPTHLTSGPFAFAADCAYYYITSINVFWLFLVALLVSIVTSLRIPNPEEKNPLKLFNTTTLKIAKIPYDLQWSHANRPLTKWRLGKIRQEISSENAWIDRLETVQVGVNHYVRYVEDYPLYGKLDYWASPDETVERMAGDCEDSAILKMAILSSAGFPKDKMFLTIGRDLVSRNAHAILTVEVNGEFYVLDQLSAKLVKAEKYRDFAPLLTISNGNYWVHSSVNS